MPALNDGACAMTYKIFGSELSPYSIKVRSYFRYKGIPHEWTPRTPDNIEEFQRFAKLPLVPLVVTPEETGLQDSTPIIDAMETQFPEPSIHPEEPVSRFISVLLEEFGDEWGNKWMFHQRWARQADQLSAAGRIVGDLTDEAEKQKMIESILDRMVNRVWFVGSNEETAPIIEASFRDGLKILDAHLAERPYLFGNRPSYADFGLWGQICNAWTDPTGASMINNTNLNVLDWIQRMYWPTNEGDFEPWSNLAPGLTPLLTSLVGDMFLPWSVANSQALANGDEEFNVDLAGQAWHQKPQKYHARSLAVLQSRYQEVTSDAALNEILEECHCLASLQ
jgi:glutathione S-transferase